MKLRSLAIRPLFALLFSLPVAQANASEQGGQYWINTATNAIAQYCSTAENPGSCTFWEWNDIYNGWSALYTILYNDYQAGIYNNNDCDGWPGGCAALWDWADTVQRVVLHAAQQIA
jgi:hypothetical protein